jgi:hypothetical protein
MRKQADEIKWGEVREKLLEIARQYDLLAESVERQRGS